MNWKFVLISLIAAGFVAYLMKHLELRAVIEQLKRELRGD